MVKDYPLYIKFPAILLSIILSVIVCYYGRDILLPFFFALLISVLLDPVKTFLVKHKVPNILAIVLTLILAFAVVGGIFYFISSQLTGFGENLPQLKNKLLLGIEQIQRWLEKTYNLTTAKQVELVKQGANNAMKTGGVFIGQTLSIVSNFLVIFTLLPVYIFLLLFYKPLLKKFIKDLFAEKDEQKPVAEIMSSVKLVIRSYIIGLLIEAAIVAVMNSTALIILGIESAILLGVIGALLNMIPYLGGLIAITLPVLIAFATKEGFTYPLLVIGAYLVIQFIDNNFIIPKVVGSKVKINALVSIVSLLIFGALWGIAGMFLSLPFIAIFKIIFDHINSLKPWGMLFGDDLPEEVIDPETP